MPDAKKRIALIDDDPSIDRTIGRILEKNGYEVHVSTDSKTAIECLKQKSYDAIIIDYDLGSGDTGLDIIRNWPVQTRRRQSSSLPDIQHMKYESIQKIFQ
jgi:DNA-binding response OmpR family regulator